uniref:Uncharacterized protein n=1 Tax=Anopheles christyi TaxID=43041 RepID=A0A182K0M1_9DIPT
MLCLRTRVILAVIFYLVGMLEAVIYQCDHFNGEGEYTVRHCTLHGVTVVHDAADIDFSSEYPRPYWFDFQHSNMDEIPRALFTTFPEMQTVDFRETGIENINKFTFENAKQLRHLFLHRNKLTVLNNFIFKGCERLEWLDLSYNQLQEVRNKTFHDIATLTRLDLNHNRLETLPADVFWELPALAHLSLNDNQLTVLDKQTFFHSQIVSLNLNFNLLREMHMEDRTQSWQRVHLRGNLLTTIDIPSVPFEIDVSHNNITEINVIYSHNQLQSLDLSHNQLADISNVSVLSDLHTLDVSFNPLNSLPLTTYLQMKQLSKLNLESTNLTALEHGLFSQQTNLTWLDVSFNRLQTIDLTVLTAASKLEHLHIDGNNLTSVEYERLSAMFPSLTYLGLFANSWNCSYLVDLVHYCRQHSINVAPLKSYGTALNTSNVQGIFCKSSQSSVLPVVTPVEHPMDTKSSPGELSIERLLEMMQEMNKTTEQLVQEMMRAMHQRSDGVGAGSPVVTASCTALHAYNYQVFILLILFVILILNVGFLLWVHHNANVRRAVDQMIIFRRENGASIQTALHEDL